MNLRIALAFLVTVAVSLPAAAQEDANRLTKADIDRYMKELSNWGRWGKDDQLGTLNLITPEKRIAAARLVTKGITVSLSRDAETEPAVDNPRPFKLTMVSNGPVWAVDDYQVTYHGFAHTHIDALCHKFHEGTLFNGFKTDQVTDKGSKVLSVRQMKNGIFTRAILFDIPRLKGVDFLEPGTPIYPDQLEAWEKKTGVKVGSGDIVLIRTGRWARRAVSGPWDVSKQSAGLHGSCAKWLRERDAAIVGSDAASDVFPSRIEGVPDPIHQLTLLSIGMPILDNCDLEAVAKTCAELKRWEFLLTVDPLAVEGGTGSPVNPVAAF